MQTFLISSLVGLAAGYALHCSGESVYEFYKQHKNEIASNMAKNASDNAGSLVEEMVDDVDDLVVESQYKNADTLTKPSGVLDDAADDLAVKKLGGSKSADIGNKLDYIFGKGTGNKHNIQRSQSMQIELEKIGIHDDLAGRDYLTEHLNKVLNDSSNISSVEVRSYVTKDIAANPTIEYTATTRESLLMGPYGGVKLKTIWDGDRLLTIIVEGGY